MFRPTEEERIVGRYRDWAAHCSLFWNCGLWILRFRFWVHARQTPKYQFSARPLLAIVNVFEALKVAWPWRINHNLTEQFYLFLRCVSQTSRYIHRSTNSPTPSVNYMQQNCVYQMQRMHNANMRSIETLALLVVVFLMRHKRKQKKRR